jgi:hypothetical protein
MSLVKLRFTTLLLELEVISQLYLTAQVEAFIHLIVKNHWYYFVFQKLAERQMQSLE